MLEQGVAFLPERVGRECTRECAIKCVFNGELELRPGGRFLAPIDDQQLLGVLLTHSGQWLGLGFLLTRANPFSSERTHQGRGGSRWITCAMGVVRTASGSTESRYRSPSTCRAPRAMLRRMR